MASPEEPLMEKAAQTGSQEFLQKKILGEPCHTKRFSWKDLGAVGIAMIAFAVAMVVVFDKSTAVKLKQTDQLIMLGVMLSVMGACAKRQMQRLFFVLEAHAGSTIQNFDALLQGDFLSQEAGIHTRATLLFLFLLPLALGVSYKRFIGGSTTAEIASVGGSYGLTAAPGYQRIGNGLSLLVNVYLPFWIHPTNGTSTYGFNLYVPSNGIAAVLDAPLPNTVLQLQKGLKQDESLRISTHVNATVSEISPLSDSERNDPMFWQTVNDSYVNSPDPADQWGGVQTGMLAGSGDKSDNFTEIYVSYYNTTQNENFNSTAQRYLQTIRRCHATWTITKASILLSDAAILQTGQQANSTINQQIIYQNEDGLYMFSEYLGEYAPMSRQHWFDPLPYSSFSDPQYEPAADTTTPLVASMLWARLVSANGIERTDPSGPANQYVVEYDVDTSQIITEKQVPTVKRSPWLIVVLAINLVFTVLAVLVKALLYGTPIGEGFGVVSLLAGVRQESLEVLHGAALSGKLHNTVRVRFAVKEGAAMEYERLELDLGVQGRSDSLDPKKFYG